ncbi:MAG: hypothetical protein Q8Q85_09800 [Gemmatimonadales bacterium]|nr:hypothetical protein [Gemmatimonadales bacterium]
MSPFKTGTPRWAQGPTRWTGKEKDRVRPAWPSFRGNYTGKMKGLGPLAGPGYGFDFSVLTSMAPDLIKAGGDVAEQAIITGGETKRQAAQIKADKAAAKRPAKADKAAAKAAGSSFQVSTGRGRRVAPAGPPWGLIAGGVAVLAVLALVLKGGGGRAAPPPYYPPPYYPPPAPYYPPPPVPR